jgi:hypothetical protein
MVDDGKRLKIFMAPEFYFRGKRGAYEIDGLFYLLEKVRAVTFDHPHWLFVLGTCVCSIEPETSTTAKPQVELQNYAIIQKGGYAHSDGIHDLLVLKEYPSHIDFKHTGVSDSDWYKTSRTADLDKGGVTRDKKGKLVSTTATGETKHSASVQPGSREMQGSNPGSSVGKTTVNERSPFGCIFAMDGIIFGLEVCRDHHLKRLVTAKDCAGVQVHLIPSAGMNVNDAHTLPRTVVFNVDGLRAWANNNPGVRNPGGAVDWYPNCFNATSGGGVFFPDAGTVGFVKPITIPS